MKSFLPLLALLLAPLLPRAAEPPLPDQTFDLTFDKMSAVAAYAAGDPVSPTFNANLEFRTFPGHNGKNAFNILEGEKLHYRVAGNIHHRQGTFMLWVMANNYDPGAVKPSDTDKSHKSIAHILFSDGTDWTRLFLYEYWDTPTLFFYWHSSRCKPTQYQLAGAPAAAIRRKQWYHLAVTWDSETTKIYLDGRLRGQTRLPAEGLLPANFKPDDARSFIGIRSRLWPDAATDVGKETVVDDVKIFSRALSGLEIERLCLATAPRRAGQQAAELPAVDIQLNGLDSITGRLDRLRVDLDYHPLAAAWQQAIRDRTVRAASVLTTPDGRQLVDSWTPAALREARTVVGVDRGGSYRLALTLTDAQGQTIQAAKEVNRPDTSWGDNGLGLEDEVPPPWTPLKVGRFRNVVNLWGRTYRFGSGPFPTAVEHGGDSLLRRPPELLIETTNGPAALRYHRLRREVHGRYVDFSGEGRASDFTIAWTTRVEFDGLIRTDFTIHGSPTIRSMKLVWTVERRFSDYLLGPLLLQQGNGTVTLPFPYDSRQSSTVLWLTSEQKGFCWTPEHDANWVYDRTVDEPIRATVDDSGGACTVEMIRRPVTVPEGAAYHAMFIATPSRPLPRVARTFRLGGYGRFSNCDVSLEHHVGEGTESVFTLRPGTNFSRYANEMLRNTRHVKRVAIYGGATGLNDFCPAGRYFGAAWNIPGGPSVPFSNKYDGIECLQINCCPRTRYSDFILDNIRALLEHPDQLHSAIYYDLANNYVCANNLHDCQFTDAFGHTINRLIVMGLRRHLLRTMAYCHRMGRDTIYHAHSYYNPIVHAFGDYWYPGEQYCGLIQAKGPYAYADALPDAVFRSELNMHLKGSGIVFLGNLKRANLAYGTPEQTRAMCTKLLLNDVPIGMAFEDGNVINRIWGIFLKYALDDATVTPYHAASNRVRSDNPHVVSTTYRCPDGRVLAILGNLTAEPQTAGIDFSALKAGLATVRDEYAEADLAAPGGRLAVTLPARDFMIVGF